MSTKATSNTDVGFQYYRGAFRSDLFLDVYAIHVKKVAGAAATYGKECGALALCAAAVSPPFAFLDLSLTLLCQIERALSFWASGENRSMKTTESGKRKLVSAFSETEWGAKARAWSGYTERLEVEQWRIITSEATARANLLPQDEANGEMNEETDPRALLIL